MDEWIGNGVQLGWLIDKKKQRVFVYRPGQPPEEFAGIVELAAGPPIQGFVLDLREILTGSDLI